MWIQIRDLELELDEEKRRHSETIKILRKKERQVKEVLIQSEEDQKNVSLLQESLDKVSQRVSIYKRQLQEQVSWSTPSFSAYMPHLHNSSPANFILKLYLVWLPSALTNYFIFTFKLECISFRGMNRLITENWNQFWDYKSMLRTTINFIWGHITITFFLFINQSCIL